MKNKIVILLLVFFTFALALCGCGGELKEEDIVIDGVKSAIPHAKFLNVEIKENEDEEIKTRKTYTFTNGEFEFEYNDYLKNDIMFTYNSSDCNYLEQLIEYKSAELKEILNKYNVKIYNEYDDMNIDYYKTLVEEDGIIFYIEEVYNGIGMNIDIEIDKYSDIEKAYDCIRECINLIKEYLPEEVNDIISTKFDITTEHKTIQIKPEYNSKKIFNEHQYITKYNIEVDRVEKWSKYIFAEAVKRGIVSDKSINTNEVKNHFINNLYIDDEKVESEKYNIEFVYNLDDDRYYTVVCFGKELEYNGGVKDYLQREIIEKYYSKSNYSIDNANNKTTYRINKNSYKVEWTNGTFKNTTDEDYMIFYKNNKDMKIKNYIYIGDKYCGASYYRFISLDDFAEILEMEVESIDWKNGNIYLETK